LQGGRTVVSDMFFSQANIDALQLGLRYGVWKRTGKTIGNQDPIQLKAVMRNMYNTYGMNRSTEVLDQVRVLNGWVLDYCIPDVVSALSMHDHYLRDIKQLPVPLERAQNVNVAGTKVLYNDKIGSFGVMNKF